VTVVKASSTGLHFWTREGGKQKQKRTWIPSSTLTLAFRWSQRWTDCFTE